VLDPAASLTAQRARVVFPTALSGVDAVGTSYRMDNLPLRLRKVIDSDRPTDEEILIEIIEAVRQEEILNIE
jgi:formylmethanofuran dehydrogenase subunit B